MMIPFSIVKQAHDAGLSIVPPAQDGSKRPMIHGGGGWKIYQQQRAGVALLKQWYDEKNNLTGLGLVCGKVSGGIECLDFDTRDAWDEFWQMAEYCGVAPLLGRVWAGYGELSPRGAHLIYRCSEIAGNTKLARNTDGKAFIETRGEGGFVIIAPSNGTVHPTGGEYRRVSGAIATIVTITPEERKDLWELAKSMSLFVPPASTATESESVAGAGNGKPGDDFNRRARWGDVLEPHGWKKILTRGDTTYWRRPEKNEGISATTGYAGTDYLYVFTTSTGFDSERGYSKFSAYALLNHRGDFKAATRELGKHGYGEGPRKATPVPLINEPAADAPEKQVESASAEFIALADFIAAPPVSTYLIKRVLPAQGLGQVFGSSNVGKSFFLIDMACHIAAGMDWCGHKTRRCTVLYIAAEGLAGLAGRMKAWTQRHGVLPDRLFIRPFPVGLTSEGAAAALAGRLTALPELPRLIILDTLAANFGPGNENDAKDMGIALDGLRALGGKWLVLCAHHSGHSDKTRSRGHSSLYAALDVELQVNRPDPRGPIEVTHTKCRDMDRMEPLFFNLDREDLPWADEDGEPVNSAVLVPAARPDAYEEGGREAMAPLGGKQAQALQLLRDMYATQTANVGPGGVARVRLRDWYEAMSFETHRAHRSRIRADLERRGLINSVDSFVYLVEK